jgi:hypothetical protein
MARRSGGSAAGYGLLLVLGGVVWLVNSVYEIVRQNLPFVIAILALGAVLLLIIRTVRQARPRPSPAVAPASVNRRAEPRISTTIPQVLSTAKWVQPGEAIQIQTTTIASGFFYFGEAVTTRDGGSITQYAINPKLPASRGEGDVAGSSMPYWPSYASITPQARRAFLNWMNGGRKDPACGIGHVFIFFYGLEHRMFLENGGGTPEALVAEVKRLLLIYGSNKSFQQYATKFLGYALVAAGVPLTPPRLSPNMGGKPEIPLSVRLSC